jgi:hypothetical protein
MSSASFACRYCFGRSTVPVAVLQKTYALRCDKCQALTALSGRQRSDLLDLASKTSSTKRLSSPREAHG